MPTLSPGATLGDVAEIIHAAVVLGPAAWGRESMPEAHQMADIEDRLKSQLIELFTLLKQRQISYVLVGGIAMLTYIDGRNTKDVDLVLSIEALTLLPEIVITDRNKEFARGKFGDLVVDFLLTDNPLFKLVEQTFSAPTRFLETNIQCATIEGLILLKLFALPSLYQQGRIAKALLYEGDIAILYQLNRPPIELLLDTLKPYVSDVQAEDLRVILQDIQQRIARMEKSQSRNL